ncbi:MAG: (Fe-S)-binding protein [Ignavibacteriae bacterium]|nr:(Fe-S)-binding protein [Ignavibacteriota bacterium]
MTVSLFLPCYTDQFFPATGLSMVSVLERLGHRVVFDERQTCCGQPAFNTGYHDEARRLAARFIRIFRDAEYVVAPSGSCVTMTKLMYGGELSLPEAERRAFEEIRPRIHEFTAFLVDVLGVTDVGASYEARVTLHDSCHALRELRIHDQPRALLRAVRGLDFVEMAHPDVCCGFGGTFSVKNAGISTVMGRDKADDAVASGAEVVTAVDSSCLMHIDGILRARNLPLRAVHIADILASGERAL